MDMVGANDMLECLTSFFCFKIFSLCAWESIISYTSGSLSNCVWTAGSNYR